MKMIDAIIFDIGGVLWRSDGVPLSDKWAARCGLDAAAFDQIVFASAWGSQALKGAITGDEKWKNIGALLKISDEEIAQLRQDTWSGWWDAELFDYIRTLKPYYQLGVISDASSDTREKVKDWVNLELFDAIVISAEEGVCKPDPRLYEAVLDRLGVEAEAAVFIDDRMGNVEGARRLGMEAILYHDFAQMRHELEECLR